MATKPFDRMTLNAQERPLSIDINQLQSNVQRSLMAIVKELLKSASATFAPITSGSAAFLSDGFNVLATGTPDMTVHVQPGLGFFNDPTDEPSSIGAVTGADDVSPYHPLPLNATQDFAVPANASGLTRVDIIEVRTDRRLEQPASRDILNVVTGQVLPASVNKVLAYYLDGRTGLVAFNANSTAGLSYKTGNPGAGAPATTAGYTSIVQITVANGAVSIAQGSIVDQRVNAFPVATAASPTLGPALIMAATVGGLTTAPGTYTMLMSGVTQFIVPAAGVLRRLYAQGLSGNAASGLFTVTVFKNGGSTVLTLNISGTTGAQNSDLVHTVAVAAGDVISLRYSPSVSGGTVTDLTATVEFTTA